MVSQGLTTVQVLFCLFTLGGFEEEFKSVWLRNTQVFFTAISLSLE